MKKTKKIIPAAIDSIVTFSATVAELAQLETERRRLQAERDAAQLRAGEPFEKQLAPVEEKIAAKLALAEAFADAHRDALLPSKVKSGTVPGARFGYRIGKRAVVLLSKVKEENAIAALKAQGLGDYVRQTETIAKDKILADCADDKTLTVTVAGKAATKTIALGDAGLRIKQDEAFFVEPLTESGETMTTANTEPARAATA